MTLVVGAALSGLSSPALAAGTTLFNQSFHDNTADGSAGAVSLPATPTKTNVACLSALGSPAGGSLATCASPTDPQGSGVLRLTSSGAGLEGGVFANSSVPTSQGLDVTFNSYQYGGTSPGADGLAFALAAVDPANPAMPAVLGTSGGSLGYSVANVNTAGLSHGYLGLALDAFGNFSSKSVDGSGCTDPPNMTTKMPGEVAIRGPGNGLVGYCALASSAATATSTPLVLRGATRAPSAVPVEVVYNPNSSVVNTASGLAVPAKSYEVKYTPVGGTAKTLTGTLPVVPAGLYPASWVTAAGFPKQLAFGWVGSTGSVTDFHEIDNAVVNTLNPVPVLAVTQTSYAAASLSPGSPVTYTLAVSSSGAAETSPVSVTETLPAGVLPVGASGTSGTGWVCGTPVGAQITCTSTTSPFTSGAITVNGVVNTSGVTAAGIAASTTAVATSADANPGTSTTAPAGTIPTTPSGVVLVLPTGPAGGNNDVKVTGSNLSGVTAVEIGTAVEFAAGTPVTEVLCAASGPGCFTVVSDGVLDIADMPAHTPGQVGVNVVSHGIAGTGIYTYAGGPALLFADPPTGEVGAAYSDQLTETGGLGPYTWSVSSGTLPAGLTLNQSTGLLSGTPTAAAVGTDAFTVKVTDSALATDTRAVSLSIVAAPALAFPAPPGGWTRTVYTDTLTESGGTAPFTWTISSGSLPAGISLSPDGVLSGTPTATGTASFTVKVTDAHSQTATEAATLIVAEGVRATGSTPPQADLNVAYSYTATAAGGTAPYTWSINDGSLPPGLAFSSAGVLSGTPTVAGSTTFSANVVDQNGGIDTISVTFVVTGTSVATTFGTPPAADLGTAYSDQLTASGGTGPYVWSISSGALPAGLTLDSSTGLIAGTPNVLGSASFTVKVADLYQQFATKATTLNVVAAPLLGFASPPAGEVGAAYSDQLTKSGGRSPYVWTVSVGSLPAGLGLGSTGLISGTPMTSGLTNFTIALTDANGVVATQATSINVIGDPVLAFATPPAGEVNVAYSDPLAVSGGVGPYTWSISAGALPAGVLLGSTTGVISGAPTESGSFGFTVKVTDSSGQFATQATTLTVVAAPALGFATPPAGEVGVAYSDRLTESGGTGPFVWSVSGGSLPAGLSLAPSTGLITGTPSASATSSFTIQVKDANNQVATQATSISVVGDPVLAFATPPGGEVGAAYSDQLAASGGTGSYTWSTTGSLPSGVTLGSSGLLSGTPTVAGSFSFTVKVTDSTGQFATEAASVTVVAGPALGFAAPPAGELGAAYSDQLTASGGTTPYAWSASAGLPPGVSLGASTGLLSGTPTAGGIFSFTVTVTDAAGQVATEAATVDVMASISISPAAVPEGVMTNGSGASYGPLTLTANGLAGACGGGASTCVWSVSPALPPGLSLSSPNAASAVIAGAPTAVKTAVVTVTVSQGGVAQATFALTISDIENLTSGIGAFPTGMVADTRNARVYVAASKANQVDSIDATANPIVATPVVSGLGASVLRFPDGLAYNSAGNALFASDYGSTSAAQVSPPATGTARSDPLPGCGEQSGIAEDSGGRDVWVGCAGNANNGRLAVMTPAGSPVGSFVLAAGASSPSGVAPTGTSGHVGVADSASGRFYTVSATGVVGSPAVLPVGSVPANVAFASVGGTPFDYVADPGTGQFSIVSEANDASPVVAASVTLPKATNPSQPYGIATDGSALVVSDADNANAYVYTLTNTAPYATLQYTIALPSNAIPDGVADMTVAGTNLAFIGNEGGNSVTVIDPPQQNAKAKAVAKATARTGANRPSTAPIHLGLIRRPVVRGLLGSPRARARAGHGLYPGVRRGPA
ncbi:MAG TPA: putative Ig domain-containing protein [Solirubrobacteraceae bacterium]|nr:putative Ig domain-containing protein [Solirubrobacteraceae bacterium]